MTNGENILNKFPNITTRIVTNVSFKYVQLELNDKWLADFDIEWWNAEYKEPTTKNNLAVDADKLISDCEKMSFDMEIFNKPLKVVALDAVKNIVKDMPSVTPQEPQTFKWCTDCREYNQEKHCCYRWSKVIRNTVEEMKQEYIEREVLDKIRAEANKECISDGFGRYIRFDVLEKIIDKYKAENNS